MFIDTNIHYWSNKLINQIGEYSLLQRLESAQGLSEFSKEEYLKFEKFGYGRTLEDERIFNGNIVEFSTIIWDYVTLGSTKGKIYKICLQKIFANLRTAKKILKQVRININTKIGKYNEHPFLSKKYYWDRDDGNIILEIKSNFGHHSVNIFFTSNIIREQYPNIK